MALEDLEWALFSSVEADEIEVAPIGRDLGKEVMAITKLFAIEELMFDQTVNHFDVHLPGVTVVADLRIELADQAFGTKTGASSEFDDLPFQAGSGLCERYLGARDCSKREDGLLGTDRRSHFRTVLREQPNSRTVALIPYSRP